MNQHPANSQPGKTYVTILVSLTLLLALGGLGWLGWQANMVRERKVMLARIENGGGGYVITCGPPTVAGPSGGTVYDPAMIEVGHLPEPGLHSSNFGADWRKSPSTVRQWLGDDVLDTIWLPADMSAAEAIQIEAVFPEANFPSVPKGVPQQIRDNLFTEP